MDPFILRKKKSVNCVLDGQIRCVGIYQPNELHIIYGNKHTHLKYSCSQLCMLQKWCIINHLFCWVLRCQMHYFESLEKCTQSQKIRNQSFFGEFLISSKSKLLISMHHLFKCQKHQNALAIKNTKQILYLVDWRMITTRNRKWTVVLAILHSASSVTWMRSSQQCKYYNNSASCQSNYQFDSHVTTESFELMRTWMGKMHQRWSLIL